MAKSFSEMRKKRTDVSKLAEKLEQAGGKKKDFKDSRFWKPTKDKSGNAFATIRFLPAPQGEEVPWVQVFSHAFQGPSGKWLFEGCPTTLERDCPICKINGEAWAAGDQDTARKRKRKLKYIANILVISDPNNPSAEGKVFLYEFGKTIFDKIMDAVSPEFEDETPCNVFDFWEGADFKLKVRKVDGFDNYDRSDFAAPSELFDGDEDKLEEVWNKQYALGEFVAEDKFKSYEKLEERLRFVLGASAPRAASSVEEQVAEDESPQGEDEYETTSSTETEDDDGDDGDDGDDALARFKAMMEGDD